MNNDGQDKRRNRQNKMQLAQLALSLTKTIHFYQIEKNQDFIWNYGLVYEGKLVHLNNWIIWSMMKKEKKVYFLISRKIKRLEWNNWLYKKNKTKKKASHSHIHNLIKTSIHRLNSCCHELHNRAWSIFLNLINDGKGVNVY